MATQPHSFTDLAVFVSSTYVDLKIFREKAEEFLSRIEAEFKSMRYFGSKEGDPLEYCLEQLRKCNFYIGIVGHRYGNIHDERRLSFTELEYEEAKRIGIGRCLYLADSSLPISAEYIESDDKRKMLELFKQKLKKENTIATFTSPEDLALKIASDILSRVAEKTSITSFARRKYLPAMRRVSGQISFLGLDIQAMKRHRDVKLEKVHVHSKFSEIDGISDAGLSKRTRRPLSQARLFDIAEHESLSLVQMISRSDSAVILGDPGSGKTTLAKYLVLAAIDKLPPAAPILRNLIPMRTPLRSYAEFRQRTPLGANILDFLKALARADLQLDVVPDGFFEYYLGRGEALLIFDGLDEIFDAHLREQVRNDIVMFTQVSFPGNRVITTSRKNGYEETGFNPIEFTHFEIEPFDHGQISEYIEKWYRMEEPDRKKREVEIADLDRARKNLPNDLLRNPLLLSLIVILFRSGCSLPESKLEIYRSCVGTLTEKWDAAGKRLDLPDKFNLVKDKKNAFARLAYWMYRQLSKNAPNQKHIKYDDILGELTRYLCEREFKGRETDAQQAAECFLDYAARRSIFVEDRFSHKTFHEYFAALYLYRNFCLGHPLDELYSEVRPYLPSDYWTVVLELLFLMIDEQAGPLAEALLTKISTEAKQDLAEQHRLLLLPLQVVWQMQHIRDEYAERIIELALDICLAAPLIDTWSSEPQRESAHHRIFAALSSTPSRSRNLIAKRLHEIAVSTQDSEVLLRIGALCLEYGLREGLPDVSEIIPRWDLISKDLARLNVTVFNHVYRHSPVSTRISTFIELFGTDRLLKHSYPIFQRPRPSSFTFADLCLLLVSLSSDEHTYEESVDQILNSSVSEILLDYWTTRTLQKDVILFPDHASALKHLSRTHDKPREYLVDWIILSRVVDSPWAAGSKSKLRKALHKLVREASQIQTFYCKLLLGLKVTPPPREQLGVTVHIYNLLSQIQ